MEAVYEVNDLAAELTFAARDIQAHLPVKRRLQRVLHRQGTTRYQEQVREARRHGHAFEGRYELRHLDRVNVRIGGVLQSNPLKRLQELGLIHLGVIVRNWPGGKEREEVQIVLASDGIANVDSFAAFLVKNLSKTIHNKETSNIQQ